jgi:hypothetical protein
VRGDVPKASPPAYLGKVRVLVTKEEYAVYLNSDHWKALRSDRLRSPNVCCQRCSLPRWLAEIAYSQDLNCHHRSYANLGSECPEELEPLCRRCHEIDKFGRSNLRAPKSTLCELCSIEHWNCYSPYCSSCTSLLEPKNIYALANLSLPGGEQQNLTIGKYLLMLAVTSLGRDPEICREQALKCMDEYLPQVGEGVSCGKD